MNKHNNQTSLQTISSSETLSPTQMLTIPTRVHSFMNEKMKTAVAVMNKDLKPGERELTVAEFLRIAAAEKVAAVLHEEVTQMPPVVRGRGGDMAAQLAKQLGISKEELRERAANLIASQAFGYKGPGNELMERVISGDLQVVGGGGNSTSGQRKPNESGQHQIQVSRNVSNGRTQRRTA